MAFVPAELYARVRQILPELLKFGIVGGIGTVVDLGGAALLHGSYHVGPLEAKAVSVTAATVITYLGSRFWTFKDRENQELKREAVLFIVLNVVGLLIAEGAIGLVTYAMSLHGQLEYNIASFLGTAFGTIFRYFAYKKWVFLPPDERPAAASAAPAPRPFPDYPPWELDPVFPGSAARAAHTSRAPVTAPSFPPARKREQPPAWDPALAPTMSWSAPVAQPAPVAQFPPVAQHPTVRAPDIPRRNFPASDYPARDYPAPDYPARDYPAPDYPARDYPARDYPAPAYPASDYPTRDFPARDFPARGFPARDLPAATFPAPAQPPRRPAPPRSPAPRPSGGGGRHRKS